MAFSTSKFTGKVSRKELIEIAATLAGRYGLLVSAIDANEKRWTTFHILESHFLSLAPQMASMMMMMNLFRPALST